MKLRVRKYNKLKQKSGADNFYFLSSQFRFRYNIKNMKAQMHVYRSTTNCNEIAQIHFDTAACQTVVQFFRIL